MDLEPAQVADAEACGVSFRTATPAQVQRFSMQRKVFRVCGEAVLATRDGALFETAGTLERLIAEGGRQRRDLEAWRATRPALRVEAPAPPPPPPITVQRPARASAVVPEPRVARTAEPRRAPSRDVPRGERWQTAGAVRRGRLAQHWTSRRSD
ncbi:hypothetical protein GCM10009416_34160 [Craurococcus roseus]|uniref:Uncharacterized protein n=1 Tax=Craurococcus roseus TaxID=77585 RepID=A0ABN1FKU3_9PROT